MQNEMMKAENNTVFLRGKILKEIAFSHKVWNDSFYETTVSVQRLSDTEDFIPVILPETLVGEHIFENENVGKEVELTGRYRSRNVSGHLQLYVYAEEFKILTDDQDSDIQMNEIYLNGYICKKKDCRKTPKSHRTILDFFIAINRTYHRSDYIPCIAWNALAKRISEWDIGTHIEIYGRIQSREYSKTDPDNPEKVEVKIAYEVSVCEANIIF